MVAKRGTVAYGMFSANMAALTFTWDEDDIIKALEDQKEWATTHGRLSGELAKEIKRYVPVDTGDLKKSILPFHPTKDVDVFEYNIRRPKAIAGVSIGSSIVKKKEADLAPYWAFVEYGTGLRGGATRVEKPLETPRNWRYGVVAGQKAQAYIRRGIRSFITKVKAGTIRGF